MTEDKKPRSDYTSAKPNCRVYTIEFIAKLGGTGITEIIERSLDELHGVGVAGIVNEQAVTESFDEARAILSRRKI